tara:strand:+ start:2242 stop:2697 length:456 start_codon:yes stop_codon:yes gene_type:complete
MDNKKSLQIHMEMGMLISSAHKGMMRKFVQNSQEDGIDISLDQWMVLGPIWQLGNPSQKQLSDICLKDKGSITRILDILEKKSLVVRVADQIDSRIKRIVLTNNGKELFVDAVPIMEKTRQQIKKYISEEEIEIFKKVLIKINKSLDEEIS